MTMPCASPTASWIPVDQLALVVGLAKVEREVQVLGDRHAFRLDVA